VLQNQNGMVRELTTQGRWVATKLGLRRTSTHVRPSAHAQTIIDAPVQPTPVRTRPLEVSDLTVRYGSVTAVDNLSFSVEPGQVVGLIGPNGAGKTTVIDAVTGVVCGSDCTLTLDGERIERWSAARRARAGISRSFQSLELFEDSTVLDNLLTATDPSSTSSYLRDPILPVPETVGSEVIAAVREFGFEDSIDTLAQELPYAQRRLLAIARAVSSGPSVLLLDEPAAGLGDAETAEAAVLVRRLADEWGMGILVVEHDMNFVMTVCDHIVVLDFGRKIAEGTPSEVQRDPAVLAAYLSDSEDSSTTPVPDQGKVSS